jgi:hypothetical protein
MGQIISQVTVNAEIKIRGHGNVHGNGLVNARDLAEHISQMIRVEGDDVFGIGEPRPRYNIMINCGLTVMGNSNIIGVTPQALNAAVVLRQAGSATGTPQNVPSTPGNGPAMRQNGTAANLRGHTRSFSSPGPSTGTGQESLFRQAIRTSHIALQQQGSSPLVQPGIPGPRPIAIPRTRARAGTMPTPHALGTHPTHNQSQSSTPPSGLLILPFEQQSPEEREFNEGLGRILQQTRDGRREYAERVHEIRRRVGAQSSSQTPAGQQSAQTELPETPSRVVTGLGELSLDSLERSRRTRAEATERGALQQHGDDVAETRVESVEHTISADCRREQGAAEDPDNMDLYEG